MRMPIGATGFSIVNPPSDKTVKFKRNREFNETPWELLILI